MKTSASALGIIIVLGVALCMALGSIAFNSATGKTPDDGMRYVVTAVISGLLGALTSGAAVLAAGGQSVALPGFGNGDARFDTPDPPPTIQATKVEVMPQAPVPVAASPAQTPLGQLSTAQLAAELARRANATDGGNPS